MEFLNQAPQQRHPDFPRWSPIPLSLWESYTLTTLLSTSETSLPFLILV